MQLQVDPMSPMCLLVQLPVARMSLPWNLRWQLPCRMSHLLQREFLGDVVTCQVLGCLGRWDAWDV